MIVQVFQCTASVTPGRHGTDGNPPRSIRRPFRLEEPFVSPLQRIPVNPAVNKGTDRLQIFPKGKRAGAGVRLIGTPTCIEARRFELSPCAPLPVENGEMILAAVFYRMRNKLWAAHCFLQRRQEQAFKSLDFRIPVGFLHYCESRKCDAGRDAGSDPGPAGHGRHTRFHAPDPARLATAYEDGDEKLTATDPPGGAWSRFPDEAGGLVSTAADLIAFGWMPLRGGGPVLKAADCRRDDQGPIDRPA